MIGSIIGDICGYPYQSWLFTYTDESTPLNNHSGRMTDDSILTIAVADYLLHQGDPRDYLIKWFEKYPEAGYGPGFYEWATGGGKTAMQSTGNGSAMRISPLGWYADSLDTAIKYANIISAPSHSTTEAATGAFVIAEAVRLARQGAGKDAIRGLSTQYYGELIGHSLYEMIKTWDKTTCRCAVTVPQAINCFLLADSYEDCIKKSLLSQGDVDTIACVAGGIAEAHFGASDKDKSIPKYLIRYFKERITPDTLEVYLEFRDKYNLPVYLD